MKDRIAKGLVHFGEDETTIPNNKTYLKETELQSLVSIKYKDGRVASNKLYDLMGAACFSNPKDVDLLSGLLGSLQVDTSDIVVDFFAGSGTTGHAVLAQNMVDGGNRRYVLIQLPESLDPEKKEQKIAAEYCQMLGRPLNIAELTKERLRRVGKNFAERKPNVQG